MTIDQLTVTSNLMHTALTSSLTSLTMEWNNSYTTAFSSMSSKSTDLFLSNLLFWSLTSWKKIGRIGIGWQVLWWQVQWVFQYIIYAWPYACVISERSRGILRDPGTVSMLENACCAFSPNWMLWIFEDSLGEAKK